LSGDVTGSQGRRQKNFQKGGQPKKIRKIAKRTKNSTIKPLPGGPTERKTEKIAKKHRKIALLSLYLLYLCYV